MRAVRHLCVIFGLLSVLDSPASESPYPEVFDEFITGWVDYDDGYYAGALRSFARAYALDPKFRPATEAMAASLGHMGMPEVGEAILRDRWVSKGSEYTYRPAIAFWGIFHTSAVDAVLTANLEQTVTDTLDKLLDTPVVLTSPSTSTWAERKNQQPCEYNLLIFLFQEPGEEHAIARIHVIRNYSVASGKELDLALSTIPTQFAHQKVEINLDPSDIAQLSSNQAFHQGLRELFDPDVEIENPAYQVDAETEASFDRTSTEDPWMHLSKASVWTEFAVHNYSSIEKFYAKNRNNGAALAALQSGFPEWLAHQLEIEHPMRPWLLAQARHANYNSFRWHPKKAAELREELLRDYPEHPAMIAIQFSSDVWGLNHLNYKETIPLVLPNLEKLKRLPPELFSHSRDFEYLQRFDKTARACMGEAVDEPFVPCIIKEGNQKISKDGSFRLSFTGNTPKLLDEEVRVVRDHDQFAELALIDKMWTIKDVRVMFESYKEHVDRDDAVGAYLKRIRNGVLHRIKTSGKKDVYKDACEWWIQVGVDLIESGASWGDIGRILPSYYLPYADNYNQPILEAMNRRLEQRGMLQNDENASLSSTAATTWKISFSELSPKSQQVVIQYYRDRATQDLEGYLRLLAWLHWSDAKELFRSEVIYAWKGYIHALNDESSHTSRIDLAHKYMQLLVAAEEPFKALDACTYVFQDVVAVRKTGNGNTANFLYNLRTIRVKALIGADRTEEAIQEIDRMLQEMDGQLIRYTEYYIYTERKHARHHSLSSILLELKDAIQQKK